jgi:hypothetical protein
LFARIGIIGGHVERVFDRLPKDTLGDAESWRETID